MFAFCTAFVVFRFPQRTVRINGFIKKRLQIWLSEVKYSLSHKRSVADITMTHTATSLSHHQPSLVPFTVSANTAVTFSANKAQITTEAAKASDLSVCSSTSVLSCALCSPIFSPVEVYTNTCTDTHRHTHNAVSFIYIVHSAAIHLCLLCKHGMLMSILGQDTFVVWRRSIPLNFPNYVQFVTSGVDFSPLKVFENAV